MVNVVGVTDVCMLLQVAVITHADGLPVLYGRAAVGVTGDDCPVDCLGTQAGALEFTVEFDII